MTAIPDDKVTGDDDQVLSKSQTAYQTLQRLRRRGTEDIDYKAELAEVLEDKYKSLD